MTDQDLITTLRSKLEHATNAEARAREQREAYETVLYAVQNEHPLPRKPTAQRQRTHRTRSRPWHEHEALDGLRVLAKRLGHTPRTKDVAAAYGLCPSLNYYKNHFGRLTHAQRIAGLKPTQWGGKRR